MFKSFKKNSIKITKKFTSINQLFINFTKNGSYFMKKGKQRKQPLKYVS